MRHQYLMFMIVYRKLRLHLAILRAVPFVVLGSQYVFIACREAAIIQFWYYFNVCFRLSVVELIDADMSISQISMVCATILVFRNKFQKMTHFWYATVNASPHVLYTGRCKCTANIGACKSCIFTLHMSTNAY